MPQSPYRLALDLSCLAPQPLSGVGYYTHHLFEAFFRTHPDVAAAIFSSAAQACPAVLRDLRRASGRGVHLRFPTRARLALWTRLNGPAIHWFTGPADIVHGCFHALPPSRRAKRIVTVFDLSAQRREGTHRPEDSRLDRQVLAHAVRGADAFIAISASCKADLVELYGVPPERVFIVHGGVDYSLFATPVDADVRDAALRKFDLGGAPYWIHLGTLEPRKNLPRLLEAYAAVRAEGGSVPLLVLAGKAGWMYEPVHAAIERLGLRTHVRITGYLERSEAIALLQAAAGCVYPSLYEGFGLPVLEAMAAGTPVLTSNVSSLPEVAGDTALLVDPESVDGIAEGLRGLIAIAQAPGPVCERARDRARTFTWESSAQALAAAYEAVLTGAGAP
ncbi:MAG: glycosyltransferase family 4 protein [Candidatus Hydrogenedentes bacterium]|nr:glycosyltransferase family 4 protein [Candidatus Hydrogenedentota bacterium]